MRRPSLPREHDGAPLDQSLSQVDNVEHIYFSGLTSGRYAMRLAWTDASAGATDYAIAWRGTLTLIPEPGSFALLLITAATVACLDGRRRRRR